MDYIWLWWYALWNLCNSDGIRCSRKASISVAITREDDFPLRFCQILFQILVKFFVFITASTTYIFRLKHGCCSCPFHYRFIWKSSFLSKYMFFTFDVIFDRINMYVINTMMPKFTKQQASISVTFATSNIRWHFIFLIGHA